MARILIAGLPPELTSWLEQRLTGVLVQSTLDGQGTQDELAKNDCSLLIIDHGIASPAAPDVVERARNGLGMLTLPVMYCLEPGMVGGAPEGMSHRLGADQLLFHPIDREEIARLAARTLGLILEAPKTARLEKQRTRFAILTKIWGEVRETVMGRLDVLEQVTATLREGKLHDELRQEGESEAHKLGGLVGTFGYSQGTRLAKTMESMLRVGSTLGEAETLRLSELVVALRDELEQPLHLKMGPEPQSTVEQP